jgi:transposase
MQVVQAEVLPRVERRRRFSGEEKRRILAETMRPGVSVSAVARRHGLHPNQLFTWRRLAREGVLSGTAAAGFVPVVLGEDAGVPAARRAVNEPRAGAVEIRLCNGRGMRVDAAIDPAVLARLAAALEGR